MPQYGQVHGLLGKGAQTIESLLPGWKAVAQQLGAIVYQPGLLRTVSYPVAPPILAWQRSQLPPGMRIGA